MASPSTHVTDTLCTSDPFACLTIITNCWKATTSTKNFAPFKLIRFSRYDYSTLSFLICTSFHVVLGVAPKATLLQKQAKLSHLIHTCNPEMGSTNLCQPVYFILKCSIQHWPILLNSLLYFTKVCTKPNIKLNKHRNGHGFPKMLVFKCFNWKECNQFSQRTTLILVSPILIVLLDSKCKLRCSVTSMICRPNIICHPM